MLRVEPEDVVNLAPAGIGTCSSGSEIVSWAARAAEFRTYTDLGLHSSAQHIDLRQNTAAG